MIDSTCFDHWVLFLFRGCSDNRFLDRKKQEYGSSFKQRVHFTTASFLKRGINMGKTAAVFHWLLLTLGLVAAQAEAERGLPNWLTGIIAVAVFLFLVFVAFLVNKAWCKPPSKPEAVVPNEYAMTNGSSAHETSLDAVRSSDGSYTYENVIVHQTDDKVTAM